MALTDVVKIKGPDGQESLVFEESLPAWESVGWKVVDTKKDKDTPVEVPNGAAGQPNPGALEAQRVLNAEREERESKSKS